MPKVSREYLARVRALPWTEVLPRLGLNPPRRPEGASFYMHCRCLDRDGRRRAGEKTASTHFMPTGAFHCFSCGSHGDVFSFVLRLKATGTHRSYGSYEARGHVRYRGGAPKHPAERPRAYAAAIRFFRDEFGVRTARPPAVAAGQVRGHDSGTGARPADGPPP